MFRNNPSSGGSVSSVRSTPAGRNRYQQQQQPQQQTRQRTLSQDGPLLTAIKPTVATAVPSSSSAHNHHQQMLRGTTNTSTTTTTTTNPAAFYRYQQIQEEEDLQSVSSEQSRQPRSSVGSRRSNNTQLNPDSYDPNNSYANYYYPPITKSYSSSTATNSNTPTRARAALHTTTSHPPNMMMTNPNSTAPTPLGTAAAAATTTTMHRPPMIRHNSLSPPRTHPQQHRRATSTQQAPPTPPPPLPPHTANTPSSHHYLTNMKRSVQRVIDDLNKAIGHDRRMAALSNACQEFDHWDTQKHDIEISLGAVNVLSLVLSMTSDTEEVQMRMICAALEMVYRASPSMIHQSYKEVGKPLLSVLLRFLSTCESYSAAAYTTTSNNNNNNTSPTTTNKILITDITLLNITKVLLYFSRVPALRTSLVQQHQGLLHALARVAATASNVKASSMDNNWSKLSQQQWILPQESRVARIRIIANLANEEENRAVIYEHVVDALVTLAVLDPSDSAREYAAASLMDLAAHKQITIDMVTNHPNVLHALIQLTLSNNSKIETREYALTAIQNLAFAKENRDRLITFQGGILLEALKQILLFSSTPSSPLSIAAENSTTTTTNENGRKTNTPPATINYDKARRRAAGAITNLICKDTVELMGNHEGLLEALVKVSTSRRNDTKDNSNSNEVEATRQRASIALTKMANCINSTMSCHNRLLASLIQTNTMEDFSTVASILRTKARIVENRYSMARYPNLLETLSYIATLPSSRGIFQPQEDAIRALMHLTNEPTNRKLMGVHEEVLDALVYGASIVPSDAARNEIAHMTEEQEQEQRQHWEVIQQSSLTAIERLATEVTNRRTMAHHSGVLVALALAVEREATEHSDSNADLTHKRFAKALLMSLLVAM
jgi:hypothetical protein